MGLARNIRRLREEAGLNQEDVARALGVDRSSVSQWETGWYMPRMGRIGDIAAFFGVRVSELVADDPEPATVPLVSLGRVHAGPLSEEEAVEHAIEVPASVLANHPRAQAAIVEGDCMDRVIPDGAAVVFDPDLAPTDGSVVIAETEDHDAVLRRWHLEGGKLTLSADSHRPYEDIVFTGDAPVRVVGTVVWMQSSQEFA